MGGASRYNEAVCLFLSFISILTLFFVLLDNRLPKSSLQSKLLIFMSCFLVFLLSLQTIPLPYKVWSTLPGRDIILTGVDLLGLNSISLPLSLTPRETVSSLLFTLPVIAVFSLISKMKVSCSSPVFVWTISTIAVFSVLLGIIQIFSGKESFLYFHEITNKGFAIGFFANVNHQASFLVMSLPIFTVLAIKQHERMIAHRSDIGQNVIVLLVGLLILIGIITAGSVAGYVLAILSLSASLMIFLGQKRKMNPIYFVSAVCLIGFSLNSILTSPQLSGLGQTSFGDGVGSRPYLFDKTIRGIKDTFPVGTGLGSFEQIIPIYENPYEVTSRYMNHSHNEYLEWTLETGILFPIFITVFMGFFGAQLVSIWRAPASHNGLRRAASLVVFIPILHSLADYPLRTPALAVFTAACIGLMFVNAENKKTSSREFSSPQNHIEL
ncbi:O-antigen ligase family protein [Hirschia baltica]|uniref:O-antigen ligase family protein n=1 Tax=Hirschia baltica TaxID=2724 RepID=UPI00131F0710|nr:O-antigen ligase family protein [Hirschia baltica]